MLKETASQKHVRLQVRVVYLFCGIIKFNFFFVGSGRVALLDPGLDRFSLSCFGKFSIVLDWIGHISVLLGRIRLGRVGKVLF